MVRLPFTILISILPFTCFCQILKVDKNLSVDSAKFFQGNLNVNFDINNRSTSLNQNVVFVGLEANSDLVYFSQKHAYIIISKLNYNTVSDGPFVSTGFGHFRFNFLRKQKVSYEVFTQLQYDQGRNMPLRFLQGGGFRFNFLKTQKYNLDLGVGGMFERERWELLEDQTTEIVKEIWKSTNYLRGKMIFNEIVNLNFITYYQVGFDYEDDVFRHRVSGDAQLNVKITNRLTFVNSFSAQFEDKPIIPINKFIFSLTNGLALRF